MQQATATRPIERRGCRRVEDDLARPPLSQNGQWFAYRLSPLQGDSESSSRRHAAASRRQGDEVRGRRRRAGGAVAFSARFRVGGDARFSETVAAHAARGAGQHPRAAAAEPDERDDRESRDGRQGEYPEDSPVRVRRRASAAGSRCIATVPSRAAARAPRARRRRRGGRGGAAGAAADAPRDTRPRGTDLILRELKTGNELSIGNVVRVRLQQDGSRLALVIDAADQSRQRHPDPRHADAARSRRSKPATRSTNGWRGPRRRRARAAQGQRRSQLRERLFSVVGFTGFGAAARRRRSPTTRRTTSRFPAGMSISGNRRRNGPRAATRSSSASHVDESATRRPTRPPERAAADGEAPRTRAARCRRAATAADDAKNERPNLVIWHYKDPRLQSQQEVQETRDRQFNYLAHVPVEAKEVRPAGRRRSRRHR